MRRSQRNKGREAIVLLRGERVGLLRETPTGFSFKYDEAYAKSKNAIPISLTFPLRSTPFYKRNNRLFAFFSNLLAEGYIREMQVENYHLDRNDRFGLLLKTATEDTVGAVTVRQA